MTIKMIPTLEEGWKNKENKRFGSVFIIKFVDTATGKTLFRYAPCYKDKPFWDAMFTALKDYDASLVQIQTLKNAQENVIL